MQSGLALPAYGLPYANIQVFRFLSEGRYTTLPDGLKTAVPGIQVLACRPFLSPSHQDHCPLAAAARRCVGLVAPPCVHPCVPACGPTLAPVSARRCLAAPHDHILCSGGPSSLSHAFVLCCAGAGSQRIAGSPHARSRSHRRRGSRVWGGGLRRGALKISALSRKDGADLL